MDIDEIMERTFYLEHLKKVLRSGVLEDNPKASGITRQVIGKGQDTLSSKQEYIFLKYVYEPYCTSNCEGCKAQISYTDLWDYESSDVAMYCSRCKALLRNCGGDLLRESSMIAGGHEQTGENPVQDHQLA